MGNDFAAAPPGTDVTAEEPTPDIEDLIEELEELAGTVQSSDAREQVEDTISLARSVGTPAVFGKVIRGYDRADIAEAFLGSLVFGIPMIIEGGSLEVGAYIATRPVFLLGTIALGVAIVYGVLYVADIQHVQVTRPLLGIIPRRFAGVLTIAFLTALVLMTVWGRVDWREPAVAFGQVAFVFVGMAIGAALGDILPGS